MGSASRRLPDRWLQAWTTEPISFRHPARPPSFTQWQLDLLTTPTRTLETNPFVNFSITHNNELSTL
tara:strand:- start:16221 stop:16421 length:201 start_codon:yes stop_codon:yes gene_type:complete